MAEKKKVKPPVEQLVDADARKKALKMALDQISKQFGKDAILSMGSQPDQNLDVVSTGSFTLDLALGVGGLPRGRIVEMYAKALGVKVDDLLLSQPDSGEQALEITDALVRSGAVDLVVIDSVAALVPRSEIEGDMGEALPGLQARLMSQALRKLTSSIKKSNTLVVFINQVRQKIGVVYGSPETTTGGNALKFYATIRMDIRRTGGIKQGDEILGNETRVKVVKNKVAPPFKQAEFEIIYGQGISREGEIIDIGTDMDIFNKSGAWYSYQGNKIGQGKAAAREWLKSHPEEMKMIEEQIKAAIKGKDHEEDSAEEVVTKETEETYEDAQ